MSRQFSGLLILIMLFAVACAMDDRRDDRRDGRRPSGLFGARAGWTRLGSAVADFRTERDRISVGRVEGTFREIMFEVDGSDLEMRDIVVTFGDGSRFSPETRARFAEGSRSRSIDLPGERRTIREVEFTYRSLDKRSGRSTITLYGR
jgi:hypothetical protein